MPRGDGTGPMGTGSRTGRGLGNCPAGTRRGLGLAALGLGLGWGLKRGFRNFWGNQNSEDKLAKLKSQATMLEEGLSKIKEEIKEIENN